MRATSSRPRLLAFAGPRRTRRAGGTEPTGQRAPSPSVDQVVKRAPGRGPIRVALTKWSNRAADPSRHVPHPRSGGRPEEKEAERSDHRPVPIQNSTLTSGQAGTTTTITCRAASAPAWAWGRARRQDGWSVCTQVKTEPPATTETIHDAAPLLTAIPTMQTPGRRSG